MNERILILKNNKIVEYIDDPFSTPGETSVISKLLPDVQTWLDKNCIGKVEKITERVDTNNWPVKWAKTLQWDELTYLHFENSEEATLFKMVWL